MVTQMAEPFIKLKYEPYITTISGTKFYFLNPDPETIDIEDIAFSLSNLCRYTGHCNRFYSVAEHCVHVSNLLPPNLALDGLLHDASEAYLNDLASPVKQFLPDYQEMEKNLYVQIAQKFNICETEDRIVKEADTIQLHAEALSLLPAGDGNWSKPRIAELGYKPYCWQPKEARKFFLERYKYLIDYYERMA